jgi:hypothetical protein
MLQSNCTHLFERHGGVLNALFHGRHEAKPGCTTVERACFR